MANGEIFVPNPKYEADRLLVVERVLGEGGLIDQHLNWVEVNKAPSADVSDTDYGYLPMRFTGDTTGLRPGREPVEFQSIATDVLGLPYDVEYATLVDRVSKVDGGWFDYLVEIELLTLPQRDAMKKSAYQAFALDTLTEDNLPTYVAVLFGDLQSFARALGIKIPATEEWSRGDWTAEEGGHMLSMNEYGKITAILTSIKHSIGRNSQLRAGMEIMLKHVIQLYAYVSWQELSTNYAHSRKAQLFGPVGHAQLTRIGQDEARHHFVYQGVLAELHKYFPEDTIRTLEVLFRFPGLEMPGSKGIADFLRKGVRMHASGVFGAEHAYRAARSVVQKLGLLDDNYNTAGLSAEGLMALEQLRDRFKLPAVPRKRTAAFVLGKTAQIAQLSEARRTYAAQSGLPPRPARAA